MEEMNELFSRLVRFAEENEPEFRLYSDFAYAAAMAFNRVLPTLSIEDQDMAIAAIREDRDLTVYYVVCQPSITEYNRVRQNYAELKSYFLNNVTISNERSSGIEAKNFGLAESLLGAENNTSNRATQQATPTTTAIREFSDEQIDILKSCFSAAFKGMGNNVNHFEENLLIDLKKRRTGIEYAKIAKLIHQSHKTLNKIRNKPFNQWYAEFCELMGIKKCTYKPSKIIINDSLRGEFYYLEPQIIT